jgi:hypothetical protein
VRWSILGAVMACLAAAMATFIGLSRVEHPPTLPSTVWLADDADDQFNLMEQQ